MSSDVFSQKGLNLSYLPHWQHFQKHPQFSAVQSICEKLISHGFLAYLAGGCVRDYLLGLIPEDFDVATNASPEKLFALFPQSLSVGKKFGIVILPFDGFQVEVASFRSEGEYIDGRHPSRVQTASAQEDACRRDFTVNALFYDFQTQQIIDYVNGQKDLEKGLLRAVGNPDLRMKEDRLRILRAIRIAVQVDFQIEKDLLRSIRTWGRKIQVISQERITAELRKMLKHRRRYRSLYYLSQTGLVPFILPELKYWFEGDSLWAFRVRHWGYLSREEVRMGYLWAMMIWPEIIKKYDLSQADSNLNKDTFGHRIKNDWSSFARRMVWTNSESEECFFILSHMPFQWMGQFRYRNQLRSIKEKKQVLNKETQFHMWRALDHTYGLSLWDFATHWRYLTLQSQKDLIQIQKTFLKLSDPTGHLIRPLVNGSDLLNLGVSPGPKMGLLLQRVYQEQLTCGLQQKNKVLDFARTYISQVVHTVK